jgi:hypothetical protein
MPCSAMDWTQRRWGLAVVGIKTYPIVNMQF